ncbi:MAG: efflux RND transporter periplasmic adaptor subunit, partial [Peptococcaceae bacterium]|nr:efflux RND transporter periplasmic adaptor subunit [Peptococcaceae bacterium]
MSKGIVKYVLIGIAVLIGIFLLIRFAGSMAPESSPENGEESEYVVPVETIQLTRHNLSSYQESVGDLRAGDTAAASAKVGGRVTSVAVKLGDRVSQGQTLVTLDSVDAANVVADVEARLDVAATSVEMSQRTVADAELAYDRALTLYEGQAISKAEFDRAESALTNATIGLQISEGQLRQAEISLATAQDALANYTVKAPMSGEVAAVNIHSGEMAAPQAPLISLVSLNPMKVNVNVSENIIGNISRGSNITMTVTALDREITGRVSAISPTIDNLSKAFPVEITVNNPQGDMRAGMVVRLSLLSGVANNVLALPTDAILEKNGVKHVFVLEDDTAREVVVSTGFISDTMSEITEGLQEGQIIITSGNQLLKDGQKV